ncbi:MAG: hypothetical protein FWD39_03625, partial [Clostridiales bacterium]|nr:hypothetical protein [Clostridiales bacterium]
TDYSFFGGGQSLANNTPRGYWGKMIEVDMTRGTVTVTNRHLQYYNESLLGRQLGYRLVWEALKDKPGIDALGSENVLCLVPGVATGHAVSNVSRYTAITKSGLTTAIDSQYGRRSATIISSESGGQFGPLLKQAGYDLIYVTGQAPYFDEDRKEMGRVPHVLHINNDTIELLKVGHPDARLNLPEYVKIDQLGYYGAIDEDVDVPFGDLTIPQFEEWWQLLDDRFNMRYRSAAVGPAGMRGARQASIINEIGRSCGRGGTGAVMGAKGLKGVVVFGDQVCPTANQDSLFDAFTAINNAQMGGATSTSNLAGNRYYGTAGGLLTSSGTNKCTKNHGGGFDPHAPDIFPACVSRFWLRHTTCYNCYERCMKIGQVQTGPWKGWIAEGPEYESAVHQSNLLVKDIDHLGPLMTVIEDLGYDTIGIGGTLAFVLECVEYGFITPAYLGKDRKGRQIQAEWGDPHDIIELIYKITFSQEDLYKWLRGGSTWAGKMLHNDPRTPDVYLTVDITNSNKYLRPGDPNGIVDRTKKLKAYWFAMDGKNQSFAAWQYVTGAGTLTTTGEYAGYYSGTFSSLAAGHLAGIHGACHVDGAPSSQAGACNEVGLGIGCSFGNTWAAAPHNRSGFIAACLGFSPATLYGFRNFALAKTFNLQEGFTREDDTFQASAYIIGLHSYPELSTQAQYNGRRLSPAWIDTTVTSQYNSATNLGWDTTTGIPTDATINSQWAVNPTVREDLKRRLAKIRTEVPSLATIQARREWKF